MSAWRMLMVANEWNELQTVRVTYPPFTLLMMVGEAGPGVGLCVQERLEYVKGPSGSGWASKNIAKRMLMGHLMCPDWFGPPARHRAESSCGGGRGHAIKCEVSVVCWQTGWHVPSAKLPNTLPLYPSPPLSPPSR